MNALLRAVEWLLVGVFLIRTEALAGIPLRFYRFGFGSDHEMSPADGCQSRSCYDTGSYYVRGFASSGFEGTAISIYHGTHCQQGW